MDGALFFSPGLSLLHTTETEGLCTHFSYLLPRAPNKQEHRKNYPLYLSSQIRNPWETTKFTLISSVLQNSAQLILPSAQFISSKYIDVFAITRLMKFCFKGFQSVWVHLLKVFRYLKQNILLNQDNALTWDLFIWWVLAYKTTHSLDSWHLVLWRALSLKLL